MASERGAEGIAGTGVEADSNCEQNCACLPDHKFLCIRLIKQQKGNENIKLPRRVLPFCVSPALSPSWEEQKKVWAAEEGEPKTS